MRNENEIHVEGGGHIRGLRLIQGGQRSDLKSFIGSVRAHDAAARVRRERLSLTVINNTTVNVNIRVDLSRAFASLTTSTLRAALALSTLHVKHLEAGNAKLRRERAELFGHVCALKSNVGELEVANGVLRERNRDLRAARKRWRMATAGLALVTLTALGLAAVTVLS